MCHFHVYTAKFLLLFSKLCKSRSENIHYFVWKKHHTPITNYLLTNALWKSLFALISAIFKKMQEEVFVIKCQNESVKLPGLKWTRPKSISCCLYNFMLKMITPLLAGLVKIIFVLAVSLLTMLPNTGGLGNLLIPTLRRKEGRFGFQRLSSPR